MITVLTDQHNLVETSVYPHAKWPYATFNPIQSRLLDTYNHNANIAISASTASGKTVCAEIYIAHEVRVNKKKALYIAPMKALASEKYDDWTSPEHSFSDLKVSLCTGDFRLTSSRIQELEEANIIIMTPEMLSSRLRNAKSDKSNFIKELGVVIYDEFHNIGTSSRGPHSEVAIMKLTSMTDVRLVLLSATMPNMSQVCEWIAKITDKQTYVLESEYRPVPLFVHYETYYDGHGEYDKTEKEKVARAAGIVQHYKNDKFLVFVHTKRTGDMMVKLLQNNDINAEFHNANLTYDKRQKLEKRFKEDPDFRVIVATSTMAWGCNTPARRVVVVGVDRGLSKVENYDLFQMYGRAGRPQYDPRGDVYVLVPESKRGVTVAAIKKVPPIRSQLLEDMAGHYKTLAFHLVSEIHHGNIKTREDFYNWFHRTLSFHQNQNFDDSVIDNVIALLTKQKVIVENGEYKATSVGVIASMFYYSPFDAADLKANFSEIFTEGKGDDDVVVANALANIDSYRFGQIVNRAERQEMNGYKRKVEEIYGAGKVVDTVIKFGFAYYNMLRGTEAPNFIALQACLRIDMDRTLEVLNALDSMSAKWNKGDFFRTLKIKLTYGVRSELVDLVRIPHVGKARAERLYSANIKNIDEFLAATPQMLAKIMNINEEKTTECIIGAKEIQNSDMV